MTYALITLVAILTMLSLNPEVDAANDLSATPYERCLGSFEGSSRETECEVLK